MRLRHTAPKSIPITVVIKPYFPPYSKEGKISPRTAAASITPAAKDKIISENSGKALDVDNAGKYDGANVQQFSYNGTDAQLWQIKDVGDGYYTFISKCNGRCLDMYGGIAENGRNISTFSSNGTKAQKFKLEKCSTNGDNGNTQNKPNKKEISNGIYNIKAIIDYHGKNYIVSYHDNDYAYLTLVSDHNIKDDNNGNIEITCNTLEIIDDDNGNIAF